MFKKHPIIIILYCISLLSLGFVFIIGKKYNIPFEQITGDPALIFNTHPFTGIVSNIGVLLWCATTSICLFSGLLVLNYGNKKEAVFLISSGIFSFILLIDDFFMFHDYILYSFEYFKIIQPITYTAYGILLLWYSINFYKVILKNNYFILGLAIIFFGMSILTDLIFQSNEDLEYFIEDSLKFIGIFSWMLFFTTTSFRLLSKKIFVPKS
jgi:hypothetical protein